MFDTRVNNVYNDGRRRRRETLRQRGEGEDATTGGWLATTYLVILYLPFTNARLFVVVTTGKPRLVMDFDLFR